MSTAPSHTNPASAPGFPSSTARLSAPALPAHAGSRGSIIRNPPAGARIRPDNLQLSPVRRSFARLTGSVPQFPVRKHAVYRHSPGKSCRTVPSRRTPRRHPRTVCCSSPGGRARSSLVALVLDGGRFLCTGQGLIPLDSYSVFTLARLSQVVSSLTAQPEISAGPSGLLQAKWPCRARSPRDRSIPAKGYGAQLPEPPLPR